MTTHTSRGRRAVAALAGAATAVAGAVVLTAPASAEPLPYVDGSYIVLLDDPALASYTGGVDGLVATKPAAGESVDLTGAAAQAYAAHLAQTQADLLEAVDADATYTYQVAFNGFAAELDGAAATKLAALPGVSAVLPNEVRSLDTVQTPDFLGLTGDDGVWADLGGVDAAGEGVVVGVIDSGVWPENPSFAGDRLRQGRAPKTDGKGRVVGRNPLMGTPFLTPDDQVVMVKADGTLFRGACELGEQWTTTALCNDKLITARYFEDSFVQSVPVANRAENEFISARDGDGHGSHTASTAAGNNGVPMTVAGNDLGLGSGMAPGAKLAVYKVCWEDDDPDTGGCYTADSIRAIEQAVIDGVDVINYSISGSTTTVVDAIEYAFYNAANAGVFVAASAGNSGPGASTVAHNSPWVTTVAATTFKRDEATVVLGNGEKYLGASVTRKPLASAPVVLSTAAALGAADATAVRLCTPGTLDPAVVTGTIVVCDRGVIDRVAKSAAVAAGGRRGHGPGQRHPQLPRPRLTTRSRPSTWTRSPGPPSRPTSAVPPLPPRPSSRATPPAVRRPRSRRSRGSPPVGRPSPPAATSSSRTSPRPASPSSRRTPRAAPRTTPSRARRCRARTWPVWARSCSVSTRSGTPASSSPR